jgi:putative ABC transport system permease protein
MVLVVLGVALGVAVVVAVDLANESAGRAFVLSMDTLAGRATHLIDAGPQGVDEELFARLRREAPLWPAAPVLEAWGKTGGETVHLLGIDPFSEAAFRNEVAKAGAEAVEKLLTDQKAVLLAAPTARRLGLNAGDTFLVSFAGRSHRLKLAGLIPAGAQAAAVDGLLLADIAMAQELTGATGRLSWIDLRLPDGAAGREAAARLRDWLPPGTVLVPARARTQATLQMTRAFRANLTAMSLLALVVGMFLIYNTMTFTVLRRRRLLGTLRLLGVTRGEIFRAVLIEALAIGLIGSAFGLLMGAALGEGLVRLVTRSINDHYFVLTVSTLLVTGGPLLKGLVLGILATSAATLLPAFEAAGVTPLAALQRSRLEERAHRLAPGLALAGAALAAAAVLLLVVSGRSLLAGFTGLFLLLIGLAWACPWLVRGACRVTAPLLEPLFGLPARLAIRGVAAGLSRTGIATAALMLAVATVVGVGVMVASFRATVDLWLQSTLRADIYVGVPGVRGGPARGSLDGALIARLKGLPGVAGVASRRGTRVYEAGEATDVEALDLSTGLSPPYVLKRGEAARVWSNFRAGRAVLISEPLAWHRGLDVGDTLTLRTDHGPRRLPVAGVYYDYGTEHGEVLMARALYERCFTDRGVSSLGLYLRPGADRDAVMRAVRAGVAAQRDGREVRVRASGEIRTASLAVFDRTFTITRVLRVLAMVVAFVGVLSAFMALVLERAKEFAVLRATGMTPGQLRALVTVQTGFMGLLAGLLALPSGLILALVLIEVINRRSFGWSMQTLLEPGLLLQAVGLALAAALLAGLYPGWKLARSSPAEALQEE